MIKTRSSLGVEPSIRVLQSDRLYRPLHHRTLSILLMKHFVRFCLWRKYLCENAHESNTDGKYLKKNVPGNKLKIKSLLVRRTEIYISVTWKPKGNWNRNRQKCVTNNIFLDVHWKRGKNITYCDSTGRERWMGWNFSFKSYIKRIILSFWFTSKVKEIGFVTLSLILSWITTWKSMIYRYRYAKKKKHRYSYLMKDADKFYVYNL